MTLKTPLYVSNFCTKIISSILCSLSNVHVSVETIMQNCSVSNSDDVIFVQELLT